jgi:signal transduction histidine kinase/CheY-like chemotaxis protein
MSAPGAKLSEHDLREVLPRLAERSDQGLCLCDLEGRVRWSNEALSGLLKTPAERLERRHLGELYPERLREPLWSRVWPVVARGEPWSGELALLEASGREVPVLQTFLCVGECIAVTTLDLGEGTALGLRAARSDRLTSLGILCAGVAHELKNPLTYLLLNLEDLAHEADRLADRDLRERAEQAIEGARRAMSIVRDLRTLTRENVERRMVVSVNTVLERALALADLGPHARVVKQLGDVPPVLADEGRLAQVFLHLLVNAAEALGDGASQANEIRVRTWSDGERVWCEVRDTGAGIPAEVLERLGEPFVSTKLDRGGLGLGLPLSRRIVQELGGRLRIDSEPRRGTSVLVDLPRAQSDAHAEPPQAETASAPVGAGRVLVIDDEDRILQIIERMLVRHRHEVVKAGSAVEALAALEASPDFDVVLCDLNLSDVTGMGLYDEVAERWPAQAERFVFITGGVFTDEAHDFLERVPNPCMEKPLDVSRMLEIVRARVAERSG